jgi:hypothetical protein
MSYFLIRRCRFLARQPNNLSFLENEQHDNKLFKPLFGQKAYYSASLGSRSGEEVGVQVYVL